MVLPRWKLRAASQPLTVSASITTLPTVDLAAGSPKACPMLAFRHLDARVRSVSARCVREPRDTAAALRPFGNPRRRVSLLADGCERAGKTGPHLRGWRGTSGTAPIASKRS